MSHFCHTSVTTCTVQSSFMPKVRVAVLGAGWWSQGWHLPHLAKNERVELVAIVEPSKHIKSSLNDKIEQAKELAQRYEVPVFETMAQLLDAKLKLDAVVCAASHKAHYELGTAALKAGLHCFMEKPMTTDPTEARLLHALVQQTGKIFMVNNTANWREQTRIATSWVAEGRLGRIQHVSCGMASPLLWLFDEPGNDGWCVPSGTMVGNGFGWGQLSHSLAWVLRVTGLVPSTVYAEMSHSERTGADLFDCAIVRCDGGASICVQGAASVPFSSYTESGKAIHNVVYGTEGMLTYSGDDKDPASGGLALKRHDGASDMQARFEFEDYDALSNGGRGPDSLLAFVAACAGDEGVFNGCDTNVGFRVVALLEAMYRSARDGVRVACVQLDDEHGDERRHDDELPHVQPTSRPQRAKEGGMHKRRKL